MNDVELYCDVARAKLKSQEELNRDYGARVNVMLGVGAGMLAVGAAILRSSDVSHILLYLVFGVLASAFALHVYLDVLIINPRNWRTAPKLDELASSLGEYSSEKYMKGVADAFRAATTCNEALLNRRAGLIRWSLVFFFAEAVAIGVLAIAVLWLSGEGPGARLAVLCQV